MIDSIYHVTSRIDDDKSMVRIHYRTAVRNVIMIIVGLTLGYYISQLHDTQPSRDVTSPSTEATVVTTATSLETATRIQTKPETIDTHIRRPKYVRNELTIRQPLYVGVITTADFLKTRVVNINSTWGHKAPKVEYFASGGQGKQALPVISLPGVDDTYPPQKKVYRMMRYIHDHYIDRYNWFMRADDDVYIRVPKLLEFLSKLDPSEDLYIGSPGMGKPEDLDRIKLHPNERYCMGGPGVIISRALLIKLVPHLEDCLQNVVMSWNEDLELGRCISRKLNVQCTWAYEMENMFFMDYSKGEMFNDPNIYYNKKFASAITAHPFKSKEMMYKIHQFFLEIESTDVEKQAQILNKELTAVQKITMKAKAFP